MVHVESLHLLFLFFFLLGTLLGPSSFFFIPNFHGNRGFILSPLLLQLDDPCLVDSPHCWILLGLLGNILFWACGISFLHFIINVDIFAFSSSLLDFINSFVDTQLTYTQFWFIQIYPMSFLILDVTFFILCNYHILVLLQR